MSQRAKETFSRDAQLARECVLLPPPAFSAGKRFGSVWECKWEHFRLEFVTFGNGLMNRWELEMRLLCILGNGVLSEYLEM